MSRAAADLAYKGTHDKRNLWEALNFIVGPMMLGWLGTGFDWSLDRMAQPELVETRDYGLPLGMKTYKNAITGRAVDVQEMQTMFERIKDRASGYIESAKGMVESGISTATNAITNMFYAALVVGGLGIVYKIVS